MSSLHAEVAADAELADHLLRGGISPRHVRRSLRELQDHRVDLIDQLQQVGFQLDEAVREAQARLGDRSMLVDQMLARPELRSRARRFAWLLFGVAPLLAPLILGVIVFFAVLDIGGYDLQVRGHQPAHADVLMVAQVLLNWGVPACVGLFLCFIALRRRMPPAWPMAGIALTGLISAVTSMDPHQIAIGLPPLGIGRGFTLCSGLVIIYLLASHAAGIRSKGLA